MIAGGEQSFEFSDDDDDDLDDVQIEEENNQGIEIVDV